MKRCYDCNNLITPLPVNTEEGVLLAQEANILWIRKETKGNHKSYEGELTIPGEYYNHRILLRMDSVGCLATLTIEGQIVRQHYGSYTEWECDITEFVKDNRKLHMKLELESKEGELSPYQKAGIFRGISLMALPDCYMSGLYTETIENEQNEMQLQIRYNLEGCLQGDEELEFLLDDEEGRTVLSKDYKHEEQSHENNHYVVMDLQGVKLWDSEHPYLYQLRIKLKKNRKVLEEVHQKVGFRTMEKREKEILWNHKPLKLRGICYREPVPDEYGRDMKKELMLFKKANVNYLRGLYYPFSKECLALCDELGFYVEQTTAVNQVGQSLSATQNSPELYDRYLEQMKEMLIRDRSHVSILLWSLGDDCTWGDNFRQEYHVVKMLDEKRLVNFHYPMSIPEEEPQMDVWSVTHVSHLLPFDIHYDHMIIGHTHGSDNSIGYAVGLASDYEMPVLHTAFAHIPCYNREQIERDPGIHEFWGESMVRYWDKMYRTKGCLGGAVLAGVDETGALYKELEGFRWGILDEDLLAKPEYHHLAMAYSPIKLTYHKDSTTGTMISLNNRFNHTNLSEIKLVWSFDGMSGELSMNAEPGEEQILHIPFLPKADSPIVLTFIQGDRIIYKRIVEEEQAVLEVEEDTYPSYKIEENEEKVTIDNGIYSFTFSKHNKLIAGVYSEGIKIISEGPYLQTTRLKLGEWKGESLTVTSSKLGAKVMIEGEYQGTCRVAFELSIKNNGLVSTVYKILALYKAMPHTVKANVGLDPGGLDELGVWYRICPEYEKLSWQRKGLWDYYPEKHIGRNRGVATGGDGDDFISMKHNILSTHLSNPQNNTGLQILSDGSHSVRIEKEPSPFTIVDDRDARIYYQGNWYEMDDYCGNYGDTETLSCNEGDYMEFKFKGTGLEIYGPLDMLYGKCSIYLDGEPIMEEISQYPKKVDFPGMSRGYEKRYRQKLYEISGLKNKEHTIKVVVLGTKEEPSQGSYVSLDYIVVQNPDYKDNKKLIINNDFNYTRLVWGNYMRKKLEFDSGYQNKHSFRIIRREEETNG